MKAGFQRWKELEARYASLSRRERGMVAAALVLAPFMIGKALVVDPLLNKAATLERGIAQQETAIAEMQTQSISLGQQLQADPDAGGKSELASLQQRRDALDQEMEAFGASLVKPDDMPRLLEQLLGRHAGLRLVSLKTLEPGSVLGAPAKDEKGEAPVVRAFDLFRHGLELRLEGNYGELSSYLEQLEKEKARMVIESLSYRVVNYPKAEMTLTIYTLSPDRAWLSL